MTEEQRLKFEQEMVALSEEYAAIDPIGELQTIIDEMVAEQQLRDLVQTQPSPVQKLIYDEAYVRDVLGIVVPLNESYPYSAALQERILEEQLLFEGFFQDAKKLKDDMKNFALSLRYIMEDPSRIKDFVKAIYESVIKEPLTKITEFIKRVMGGFKEWFEVVALPKVQAVWDKIREGLSKVGDMLEATWDKLQGMSGWKQALAVIAFGAGIGYVWKSLGFGDIVTKASELAEMATKVLDKWGKKLAGVFKKSKGPVDIGKAVSLAKKSKRTGRFPEAYIPSLSLLFTDDDVINELFGKKKKKKEKKDAVDKAASAEKGAESAGKGVDKADEWMTKLSDDDTSMLETAKEEIMKVLEPLITLLKEKGMDLLQGMLKTLGMEALGGLLSGGISSFISGVAKVWGGATTLSELFGDTLSQFVKKIKDPEEEMEEMEKGEDDPTDSSTKKKEEKKEALSRDEQLLREYIREKLLAA